MKEEYKKYGQTNYYWILEFLDSDYERSSYKKNGADIVLKMNDAKDIKELLKIRVEIHNFIEQNNIGRHLVSRNFLHPLNANRIDTVINRCFNININRLIEELPDNEESIDKALELYVNTYYIDPRSGKLTNLEGIKMKYWDCLDKYKDNISYPKGSNGSKNLLKKYNKLKKELERYGYVRHIYDESENNYSGMILGIVFIVLIAIIFIAIGGFFGIGIIIWIISLTLAEMTGRGKRK